VIVNHLKSKGSSCDSDDDPDLGDGQGNCNLARISAAVALAEWIATDPTGSYDDDFLVIGDMNAYFLEDPIAALRSAGLIDLLAGQANPYSYLFDAQSGAYDYAFASPSLAPQVVGAIEWHINIDEAPLLDYNLEHGRDPALFDASTPYRAADHDPIIIGLELTN
jgi:predicted extracellular nuclease